MLHLFLDTALNLVASINRFLETALNTTVSTNLFVDAVTSRIASKDRDICRGCLKYIAAASANAFLGAACFTSDM